MDRFAVFKLAFAPFLPRSECESLLEAYECPGGTAQQILDSNFFGRDTIAWCENRGHFGRGRERFVKFGSVLKIVSPHRVNQYVIELIKSGLLSGSDRLSFIREIDAAASLLYDETPTEDTLRAAPPEASPVSPPPPEVSPVSPPPEVSPVSPPPEASPPPEDSAVKTLDAIKFSEDDIITVLYVISRSNNVSKDVRIRAAKARSVLTIEFDDDQTRLNFFREFVKLIRVVDMVTNGITGEDFVANELTKIPAAEFVQVYDNCDGKDKNREFFRTLEAVIAAELDTSSKNERLTVSKTLGFAKEIRNILSNGGLGDSDIKTLETMCEHEFIDTIEDFWEIIFDAELSAPDLGISAILRKKVKKIHAPEESAECV